MRALDFGSSSGRVVRVMKALYPEVDWFACDPNESAIEWAHSNLPEINFTVSPLTPPLSYEDEFFDFVYAISVWTHFGGRAALSWLAEVRRVLRPGGVLVITAHGFQTLHKMARERLWDRSDIDRAASDLYARGHSFTETFGPAGDHGVPADEWGWAFLTPEWLLAHACPDWMVLDFRPGYVDENQDLITLRRS